MSTGKDDKLVQTVLQGIPKEVREKGIVTEKALRDKFDTVNLFYFFIIFFCYSNNSIIICLHSEVDYALNIQFITQKIKNSTPGE